MTKGLDERIDGGVLRWFGHVERRENDRVAKILYVGEWAVIHSVGRPRKRWIDTVKECLRKRSLDIRQERKMVEVCEAGCLGPSSEEEPLTLRCYGVGCHSYMKPLVGSLSVAEPTN